MNPIKGARAKLPRIAAIDEEPIRGLTPVQLVKGLCAVWDKDLYDWLKVRGFHTIWDRKFQYVRWDTIKPEHRAAIEELWDSGYNRVTRLKLGFQMDED